ncbi:MAG: hypothetical protein A2845_00305 [Candidatus Lloydbacteria bacterium RIFCSPHIGHO2_01_FULL_49_22]|uniref:histidine kinase n=1 Tax=Candidatus Lloydbacteria bacterium RIFCSPHIGHO2_01_FULL_49_22 TaxID=1798658 RepID=A0A1G2CXX7_9BACT|nr:MAG: hypothetical protein A2845_00305 [Candidatus Lloydbacteria bacterium RIFCSPHIGHO2_01_FULL_49_22]OGZ09306.1 MAG: hypothetical protein A3C14_05210 [Candidatus Lloydbacteria bacterium RIFCSPHIGHO2_02_FULL_50_18]
MPLNMNKYKDLFCAEAEEQLAILSRLLLVLEKSTNHMEYHEELMRSAHTIKGAAATMGYASMAELAHAVEDIFHAAERGALVVDTRIITLLLSAIDLMTHSLASIKSSDVELPSKEVVDKLKKILEENAGVQTVVPQEKTGTDVQQLHIVTPDTIKVSVEKLDTLMGLFEEMLMLRLKANSMIEPAVEFVRTTTDPVLKQQLFFIAELEALFAELARLMTEHQDALLAIRLVPLEQIFGQFPRMVRDLSVREEKAIEFFVEGGDIALDRTVIEGLGGALAHLLRNAVDHGIVSRGTISLSAVREKGRVRIFVEDSGAGIDYGRVKEVATAQGVGTSEEIALMGNEQLAELLFHQNMSTNKVVTDISGRGVGLAAVRGFAEDVGGRVEVISPIPEIGKGTRFVLDLPISLATVRVLVVQARGYTFAIPFDHVIKTLHFETREVGDAAHQETLFLDGTLLPLMHLDKILKLSYGSAPSPEHSRTAVLIRTGEKTFLLEVDACTGEQDLLIKSLPPVLRNNKGFSGSALLPDGRTILLLDGHGLLIQAIDDILNTQSLS